MQPKLRAKDTFEFNLLFLEDLKTGYLLANNGTIFSAFYLNPPKRCDICHSPFADKRFMIDGVVTGTGGTGASMCAKCFAQRGTRIEWGQGQLYTQLKNGYWLMTGGFPPSAD